MIPRGVRSVHRGQCPRQRCDKRRLRAKTPARTGRPDPRDRRAAVLKPRTCGLLELGRVYQPAALVERFEPGFGRAAPPAVFKPKAHASVWLFVARGGASDGGEAYEG